MSESEQLDAAFAALANPTRRAILARLAKGPATVNELAEPFKVSLPAVSKHIRVLQDAGFVIRERDAQFRPCRLDASPLATVASWTDRYRHIWDVRFETMAKMLETMKEETGE